MLTTDGAARFTALAKELTWLACCSAGSMPNFSGYSCNSSAANNTPQTAGQPIAANILAITD